MKVGSLVVVKDLGDKTRFWASGMVIWLPIDNEEEIYTVRGIFEEGALLEEGIIGYNPLNGTEIVLDIQYLREIQPPMKISIDELIYEHI